MRFLLYDHVLQKSVKPKFGLMSPLHAQCNPNLAFPTTFWWFIFGLNRSLNDLFSYDWEKN